MAEEIFDIVDENGQSTGETVTRTQAHAEGIRHRTAHQADPDDLHFAGTFLIQYEKEFHGKPFKDNEIAFVYVYDEEVGIDSLSIQKEELDSVEWFDLEEVYQACQPPRDEKLFCYMRNLYL